MYPEEMVIPMKQELTQAGFSDLDSAEKVDSAMALDGSTLVVINSVCGCAAGSARPGAIASLEGNKQPDNLVTVFAGFDTEAVKKVREYMKPFPPSSPCIGLYKNGELVHILERHHIEGHIAQDIAENLKAAYEEYC